MSLHLFKEILNAKPLLKRHQSQVHPVDYVVTVRWADDSITIEPQSNIPQAHLNVFFLVNCGTDGSYVDCLVVKESKIPEAGSGLFSTHALYPGMFLGLYTKMATFIGNAYLRQAVRVKTTDDYLIQVGRRTALPYDQNVFRMINDG